MKVTDEMIEAFKRHGHPLPFEPNIRAGLEAVLDLIEPECVDIRITPHDPAIPSHIIGGMRPGTVCACIVFPVDVERVR